MLKKTITFKDLDGNSVTEDFYFNLSKPEITEMELEQKGGLGEELQALVETGDPGQILKTFKWIMLKAYGIRSADNKRFIKSEQISEEFTQTDAYSVLFMELVTNAESSAAFVQGVLPPDLLTAMKEVETDSTREVVDVQLPEPKVKHPIDMTREELIEEMRKKNIG
jgi:hypothetical protein